MDKAESKYFNTAKKMDKALIALLGEKSFEYITVSEICKRAEVNRSTFYLHYDNTVDLLEETARYLIDDFTSYFNVDFMNFREQLYDRPIDDLNFMTDEYLHPYLLYIKDNKRVYSTVLSHSVSFGLNEVFQQLYDTIFNPVLERYDYPVADRKYAMMFYLNGITAIVSEWLKDGCEKSVDDVSKIICGCIFGRRGLNV